MISIAIIGGTSYTKKYLINFLSNHSFIDEIIIHGNIIFGEMLHNILSDIVTIAKEILIKINRLNKYFINQIKAKNFAVIVEVGSKGLIFGIEISSDFSINKSSQLFMENKIIVDTTNYNILKSLFLYNIDKNNINHFLYILKVLLKKMDIQTKTDKKKCHQN
ncbi:MAG: hypothetical protein CR986_08320 [Ignavibacteriae bacterium]|nr:MAG: hypothetical protein CR986_08320 [Ignavibacteriota bacterium]